MTDPTDWVLTTDPDRATHPDPKETLVPLDLAADADPEEKTRRVLARPQPHGQISGTAWTRTGDAVIYAELDALSGGGLPRRRGSSVVVLHEIDEGLDTGPFVAMTDRIALPRDTTVTDMHKITSFAAAQLAAREIGRIIAAGGRRAYA